MRSFISCTLHHILAAWWNSGDWDGQGIYDEWESSEIYTTYCSENVEERPLGRPRNTWGDNIKMHLKDVGWDGVDWIHMTCGTNDGRFFHAWIWTFRFHKRQWISWVSEQDCVRACTHAGLFNGTYFLQSFIFHCKIFCNFPSLSPWVHVVLPFSLLSIICWSCKTIRFNALFLMLIS
jgi:hypothetical protein